MSLTGCKQANVSVMTHSRSYTSGLMFVEVTRVLKLSIPVRPSSATSTLELLSLEPIN